MSTLSFISPKTQFYMLEQPFHLEQGEALWGVEVAYRSWGRLNSQGDNAVLICHALTGSADADDWWGSLFGAGQTFDPAVDFVICSNVLGSCYGTTGPTSLNPNTGKSYGVAFPQVTVRDMVQLQAHLLAALGVQRLKLVIGGSLGGMQVLEWAVMYPQQVEAIAIIAASGRHSAWCIGLSEAQRQAIYADPEWQEGRYTSQPARGLAIARMIAMTTYRSWDSFEQRFGRQVDKDPAATQFAIARYLQHQGDKLVDRFDANTYIRLTQAMDSHDLGRDRAEYSAVLRSIRQPALIVSIPTDILYPPPEQEELASLLPNARLVPIDSPHGHDAFLIDQVALNRLILSFYQTLHCLPNALQ